MSFTSRGGRRSATPTPTAIIKPTPPTSPHLLPAASTSASSSAPSSPSPSTSSTSSSPSTPSSTARPVRHATIMKPPSSSPPPSPNSFSTPSSTPSSTTFLRRCVIEVAPISHFQRIWSYSVKRRSTSTSSAASAVDRHHEGEASPTAVGQREGVTWFRPIPPAGFAVVGDVMRPYLAASPLLYLEPPVFAFRALPSRSTKTRGSKARRPAKRETEAKPVDYLVKPIDFEVVWRHEGKVHGMLPCTIWKPVPPPGYVATGNIVTLTPTKPAPGCVVCLHESVVVPGELVDAPLWTFIAADFAQRGLMRARSERDLNSAAVATFLMEIADEIHGKAKCDNVAVYSVKPRKEQAEPAIVIGCSYALPFDSTPPSGDSLIPSQMPFCIRQSAVRHSGTVYISPSSTPFSSPTMPALTLASSPSSSSFSLSSSPASSPISSPSGSFASLPSASASSDSEISDIPPLQLSPRRAPSPRRSRRSVSSPTKRSLSPPGLRSGSFTSFQSASSKSTPSSVHSSPPRSSRRVTDMISRPTITALSITFTKPSPSEPAPSAPATPAPSKSSYRVSTLMAPSRPAKSNSASVYNPAAYLSQSLLHSSGFFSSSSSLSSSPSSTSHSPSAPPSYKPTEGKEYPCPRCMGYKGQGMFGPCPPSSIHFTQLCELCEGRGTVDGPSELCRLCEGEGGLGVFGKCRPGSLHYKPCIKCHGKGFFAG